MLWGFVPELFCQTNGSREGDPDKRCLERRTRGKEPLEKGGQEWRGDLDGAHHERRTEAASLRHTEHSGTPSAPAHRGADEAKQGFSAGRSGGGEPAHRGADKGPEVHQGELEAKHQGSTERVCTAPFQHAPTG